MRQVFTFLLLAGLFAACQATTTNSSETAKVNTISNSNSSKMNQKEKTQAFIKAVNAGDQSAVQQLVDENYIQHNPHIPTGRAAFLSLFPVLEHHGTQAETVRMIEEGNYVVMHNLWKNATPFGAEQMVAFDVIRFNENGKIAEHWDALAPIVTETASGRTQTDGPVKIQDLDKTEANKALAVSLVEDVLMGKNPSKITEYISAEQYHQHNPGIKDGLSGITEAVEYLVSQDNMFKYNKIHKVLGEGNFVLTISEGEWSGKQQAFYDLFRMDNGQIVEHWDVIQPIPSENLANDNTMFDFN